MSFVLLLRWPSDRPLSRQTELIGAVTTGTLWQFGRLDRVAKHVDQGLDSYRVPDDLDALMRILVQALLN